MTNQGASVLLKNMLTDGRRKRIEQVLALRTRHITVVVDNLYHPHNISAVVRSCEAFGIQDIHAIEDENRFEPSHGIAMGAERWITLYRHSSPQACIRWLRDHGYLVLAADPPGKAEKTRGKEAFLIEDVPLDRKPVALVFGRELDGLHQGLRQLCDGTAFIPMKGFIESLNVSVTAAICLYELRKKLDIMDKDAWCLSEEEKAQLRDDWYVKSVRHGPQVLAALSRK